MLARCTNPNRWQYKYYGGRGVEVCDRWLSFENFFSDMGERPQGKTIDRLDSDGNYEPSNCRWASPVEQRASRRDSYPDDMRLRAVDLRREGLATAAIGKRLGVSKSTVKRWVRGQAAGA
jgi:hypothetical protein